jgi:hypothetical protein
MATLEVGTAYCGYTVRKMPKTREDEMPLNTFERIGRVEAFLRSVGLMVKGADVRCV